MGEEMTSRVDIEDLRELVARVQDGGGVEFSRKQGVVCPVCGAPLGPHFLHVTRTMGWVGNCRERYHRCPRCRNRFKSVETCGG